MIDMEPTSTLNKNSKDHQHEQTYPERADSFAQESVQLHPQLKEGLPSNLQGFVPNTRLDPDCSVAHAVHTALSMCCPDPQAGTSSESNSQSRAGSGTVFAPDLGANM